MTSQKHRSADSADAEYVGPYRLLRKIALGGMAEVYLAEPPSYRDEDDLLVVKRMLPSVAAEPRAAEMFAEESRLGSYVDHRNVVRVLRFGDDGDTPYLVLERVDGLDLARLRRSLRGAGEALHQSVTLYVLCELLAGLAAVHDAVDEHGRPLGIVHGDISPSNVLVGVDGNVKIADFGIAHAQLRDRFPHQAAAGRTRGKLAYLSPERVVGSSVDTRSDLFAVGVIAAELLTGIHVFAADSELATLLAIRDARVDRFRDAAVDLPIELRSTVLWALQRDPEDRPPSASVLRSAFFDLLDLPTAAVRAELAALVAEALARDENGPEQLDGTTQSAILEPPTPGSDPVGPYHVRTADGRTVGPLTFAELLGGLTVGRYGPSDLVSARDAPFRAPDELDELTEYLPAFWFDEDTAERPVLPPGADRAIPLKDGALVDLLTKAALDEADGLWTFQKGTVRKEVYLRAGVPEYVSSNVSEELLGEYLVSRDVLSRGELDMALAVLPRFEGRLGDALAALGLVQPLALFRYLQDQVLAKLLDVFEWTEGEARFTQGVPPPDRRFPLNLDPWNVLREGIERRLAAGLESKTFAGRDETMLERGDARRPSAPPHEVLRLHEVLERPTPLRTVIDAMRDTTRADPHRARRAIRLALAIGAVRWLRA